MGRGVLNLGASRQMCAKVSFFSSWIVQMSWGLEPKGRVDLGSNILEKNELSLAYNIIAWSVETFESWSGIYRAIMSPRVL